MKRKTNSEARLRQKYEKYDEEIILFGDFDVLCLEWGYGTVESAL